MTDQERQELLDAEHLRLLRIGYLVEGWFHAVWALFPLFHITLGILMLTGVFPGGHDAGNRFMGMFFVILGGAISSIFATIGILSLLTARRLRERRSRTFCLVVGALSLLGIPYGTAIGIFTILVLQRPSVAAQFQ